jgi:Flp pilus assembly pilin Flp
MIKVRQFCADESGVSSIEYALLAALMGVALVAALNTLSGQLFAWFTKIGTAVNS